MPKMIWLGLDVHADSIAVAKYVGSATKGEHWEMPNDPKKIRRKMTELRKEGDLRCAYEAGPCGYELYRQLTEMGIECAVIAPALIPRKPGERIKTDRRDADKLARMHRVGELTLVTAPTLEQEAARDLLRARDDIRKDRNAARSRLSKFLLRRGRRYLPYRWGPKHWAWLREQDFSDVDRIVFEHYCTQVRHIDDRMAEIDQAIVELSETPPFKERVARLTCLRGVSTLVAMTVLTELYDLRRFEHPRDLMAYIGLVPSEHSSGRKRRLGAITKTGNAHVRRALIEAAWSYRYGPDVGPRVRKALRAQPDEVRRIARKALIRLSKRFRRLTNRGIRTQMATVAVARELCGFLWSLEHLSESA